MPSEFTTTEPLAGSETAVTVRASPSTSVSLARTGIVTSVSSSVRAVSSTATGASFTAVTVTVTVAVSLRKPSLAV